jgi:hypothetical protein
MFNTISGPGAVEAGAALRYGSGSNQMMRLLAIPAPQHLCLQHIYFMKRNCLNISKTKPN